MLNTLSGRFLILTTVFVMLAEVLIFVPSVARYREDYLLLRLEKAQIAKYASMVDQMGAQPGDHVLEIGCGWGGFAEYAAKERGLRVTGLTISREQFNYATQRIEKAGLSDLVEFKRTSPGCNGWTLSGPYFDASTATPPIPPATGGGRLRIYSGRC